MVSVSGQPEFVQNPSKAERFLADVWKSASQREAKELDHKFNIEEITGFSDDAKDLWLAYFASYFAADKFANQDISDSAIDAGSKMPVFGGLIRLVRSSVNGGRIASIELKQEAEEQAQRYTSELEELTAEQTMELVSKDFSEEMLKRKTSPSEFIAAMKDSGSWAKLYDEVTEVLGSSNDIQRSANILSMIYIKGKGIDPKLLKDQMKNAGKRFAPTAQSEE